ncbi:hypothetical protein EJ03DRAFT_74845 [Teratosphaeria nubilosa]|uniref:Uncharacterized protein n=1 Tax=Teratosphaeria nubilosa TaxID=161662 RepID=A0A6G1LM72_9PEZI|nr:hypothetical protein EJ03DRAFT_74845 [Teratosphaeria nubilosa]
MEHRNWLQTYNWGPGFASSDTSYLWVLCTLHFVTILAPVSIQKAVSCCPKRSRALLVRCRALQSCDGLPWYVCPGTASARPTSACFSHQDYLREFSFG